jgi:hypothetical protein
MGQIKAYPPVKLFAAITTSDIARWPSIQGKLEKLYSSVDHEMDWYPFNHTQYYQEEMGENLSKRMISFAELIQAEKLPDIKLTTNAIEQEFSTNEKRTINIDPGYLTASKIVLATTKNYSHRIYLGRGIFGDAHLTFRNRCFQPNNWTYPDYKEPFVLTFFEEVRNQYTTQLAGN